MNKKRMDNLQRGARPIINSEITEHYSRHSFKEYSVEEYTDIFYNWIVTSENKKILGLENFKFRYFTQGTSHCFDNFVLRHAQKEVVNFIGDFQYHACISKFKSYKIINHINQLNADQALLISLPFSDTGNQHVNFVEILQTCCKLNIPVCLDIAYWGIAKDLNLDLEQWPCIQEVVCSLSKPFHKLEKHRIGVRFNREYVDDGICMLTEVGMVNTHSMSLGCWFMTKFSNSYNWEKYQQCYYNICSKLNLTPTNTVIFALGNAHYNNFNRGNKGTNRVCISNYLIEIYENQHT